MPYAEAPETIWLNEPRPGTNPAESAVYFCLTSASALLDVTRSLLGHLETPTRCGQVPQSRELSELSKAAGQSAFLAAVMLSPPAIQTVAPAAPVTHGEGAQRHPRAYQTQRAPAGSRFSFKSRLMNLIGARPAVFAASDA